MMAPNGYVQLFLFVLLCTGAFSAENAACTIPRAQSNIHMNQVYGDWFLGQANMPANYPLDKNQCFTISMEKLNETTFQIKNTIFAEVDPRVHSIENAEDAGTWHVVGEDRTVQVVYLSADGTTMVFCSCFPYEVETICLLVDKQLPINSERIEEVLHAVQRAGMSRSDSQLTWQSTATCPST